MLWALGRKPLWHFNISEKTCLCVLPVIEISNHFEGQLEVDGVDHLDVVKDRPWRRK